MANELVDKALLDLVKEVSREGMATRSLRVQRKSHSKAYAGLSATWSSLL